jgi:hypothetical protein
MPNPTVTAFGPGQSPSVWRPGDFLLTRNLSPWHSKSGFVSGMIRFGERLHLHGADRQYAQWNHAVAISGAPSGDKGCWLVEALGHGVVRSSLSTYTPYEYLYVATDLDDSERADFVGYVEAMVGTGYGYLTILSIALKLATGIRIGFSQSETVICSGLVCAALGIWRWKSNPAFVMPSDLAKYHNIRSI